MHDSDKDLSLADKVLAEPALAHFMHWGVRDYADVLAIQEQLRSDRQSGAIPDTWLAGEHNTVITQGVRGQQADLVLQANLPIPIHQIDRGGMTTLHNPGQLVIYPIVRTHEGLLAQARLSRVLLEAAADLVHSIAGVRAVIERGRPGLFVERRKLAAIGISIRGHVSMHGIAINLCNDLSPWKWIIPCGEPSTRPVTLSDIIGRRVEPNDIVPLLPGWLKSAWGYARVNIDDTFPQ